MSQSKKILSKFSASNPTTQVLIGAASGMVTGYFTRKVGTTVCYATGGGLIIYQLAQSRGLVKSSWNDLVQKAEDANAESKLCSLGCKGMTKFKKFASSNGPFTAGFIGGFLIGAA